MIPVVSKLKQKHLSTPTNCVFSLSPPLLSWWFFKKTVSLPTQFSQLYQFSFPPSIKGEGLVGTMCVHLQVYEIIFVSFLCSWKPWCFLSVFPYLIWLFVKIFPHFYNQIKHKADNRFYPPNKNNKSMENQTNIKCCAISGKSKLLCGLHKLGIREHSSRSVAFDMSLYYAQFKRIIFQWRSCLRINSMNSTLAIFSFWFSSTFCSEFCENLSEGAEIFLYLRQLLLINVILDMFSEVLINYFCFC